MKSNIDLRLVTLRDLCVDDIDLYLDYWFRSPIEEIEAMGVNRDRMGSEDQFRQSLLKKCEDNSKKSISKMNFLIVEYDKTPIGYHPINQVINGDHGTFHAHFWSNEHVGKGIGTYSYLLACQIFFERFQLQKIVFKTPVANQAAIRIKEKLKIPCVGKEVLKDEIYLENIEAKVFELKKDEVSKMIQDFNAKALKSR